VDGELFDAILLGLLVFSARIADVTLGTMRIVFISRGQKSIAPILGFFEILVWLFALRIVMENLTDFSYYVLFAAGFAAGTFIGLLVEDKLALGVRIIRIVTKTGADELIVALREAGHGVTSISATGGDGPVHVLFSIVKRKNLYEFIRLVREHNPKAFYSLEEVSYVNAGIFAARESFIGRNKASLARWLPKLK
jgi:uncharacterized protein YebE (UPF0316 family)